MQLTSKQISEAFSGGNFQATRNYLVDDICRNISGDKTLTGKTNVKEFCDNTAKYFSEVTTKFSISNLTGDSDCVVMDGNAEFINKENKTIHIFFLRCVPF